MKTDTVTCPSCEGEYESDRATCPHCGKRHKKLQGPKREKPRESLGGSFGASGS